MANRISLIHVVVPMTEAFRISSGEVSAKESIVIQIERDGIMAFGEASPMSGGFYSGETPESTWDFLLEYAIPALMERKDFRPGFVLEILATGISEPFAWAGLEGALWDLMVQEESRSFTDVLGVDFHPIESGLAVGICSSIPELLSACRRYMADGYKRLKIKIQPGWDIEPLRIVRETFAGVPLMVDANAAYGEEDFPTFDEIDKMGLIMVEQPFAKMNWDGLAKLQSRICTPICIDESAYDEEAVRQCIDRQACRIVNIKIQRVGGIGRAKRIHDLCMNRGIPNWVGTMPELGIAAVHALYLALLPNCTYPTDVEASSRWFVEDIISPPIEVVAGIINVSQEHRGRPNVNMDVLEHYTIRRRDIRM